MNSILRVSTMMIILTWVVYWRITEKTADKQKPKTRESFLISRFGLVSRYLPVIFFIAQLLGLRFLPIITTAPLYQYIGFIIALLGAFIGIKARRDLDTNWAEAFEYQIKHKHELITYGIYKYIRHPIYFGLTLLYTGAELVAGSYLFIAVLTLGLYASYLQGKREEKLLLSHFGNEYREYMDETKMLIPFIF